MNMNKNIHTTIMRTLFTAVMMMTASVMAWAQDPANVAKIGEDQLFNTLQDAIDKAGTTVGETTYEGSITLLTNVNESVNVIAEKNITINLAGHTITGVSDGPAITNAGTLTIQGSSEGPNTIDKIVNNGSVTIGSATITAMETSGAVTMTSGNITTLTATDNVTGDISVCGTTDIKVGSYTLSNVKVAASGTTTISGTGTISTLDNSGTITFSEATTVTTFNANTGSSVNTGTEPHAAVGTLNNSGTTTIIGEGITKITGTGIVTLGGDITNAIAAEGVTIDLNGHPATAITVADGKTLSIMGTVDGSSVATLTASAGSTLNIGGGTITTLDAKGTSTININSTTLPENITAEATAIFAFNNITSSNVDKALGYSAVSKASLVLSGEITNMSIVEGKNITIDVKDQNITSTLTNAGSLTLMDSNDGDNAVAQIANTGTLTVQSGKVTNLNATAGVATITDGTIGTMSVSGDATATINGGTITTLAATNDKVTVYGGTITNFTGSTGTINFNVDSAEEMTQALTASKAAVTLDADVTGDFTVANGKEVTLTMNSRTINGAADNSTITVENGGSLTIANSNGNINAATSQVAIVNNGTLVMKGAVVASATLNGTQTISGGTLTKATLSASKTLTVNGGNVTTLTAADGSTVDGQSGNITTVSAASGTVNIKGNGFDKLAGNCTYNLADNVTSNINIPASANVTLSLSEGKTLSATSGNTVTVASGATLNVSGTGTISAASDNVYAIENNGTVTINAGTGTITSVNAKTGSTMSIAGGTIDKVAANGGTVTISDGTITKLTGDNGTITLGAGMTGSYTVLNGANLALYLESHTMNGLTVDNGATVNVNATTGTITTLTNAGTTTLTTGNIGTVSSNTGTLNVNGGTITTATSTGTVNVTSGTVETLNANAGTTTVSGGIVTTLNAGDGTSVSTVTVSSGGNVTTLDAKNKSTVTIQSGATVGTLTSVDGATVNIENGAIVNGKTIGGGINFSNIQNETELKNAVAVTKSGTLTLGAEITLAENLEIPTGSTLAINTNGKELKSDNSSILTVAGQLTLNGNGKVSASITNNGTLTVNGATVSGTVTNSATMTVIAGAVGNVTSDNASSDLTISGGNVTNATVSAGNLNVTGGIAVTLAVSDGTATVSNGEIATMTLTGGTTTISGGTIANLSSGSSATVNLTAGRVDMYKIDEGNVSVEAEEIVTAYDTEGIGGDNVTLPSYNLTDDNPGSYPTKFKTASAKYTRQNVTAWGTICLPFSLTKSPHTNITLYKISQISGNSLELENVDITAEGIAAGTALIFNYTSYTTGNPAEIVFASGADDGKALVNKNAPRTPVVGTQEATLSLQGYFVKTTLKSDSDPAVTNCYYINGDKFHQAAVSLEVPAYRAIIVSTASAGARPSVLNITTSGTTAVDTLLAGDSEILGYYDQRGVMHSAPVKGVNIVKMANGQSVKLIIK